MNKIIQDRLCNNDWSQASNILLNASGYCFAIFPLSVLEDGNHSLEFINFTLEVVT